MNIPQTCEILGFHNCDNYDAVIWGRRHNDLLILVHRAKVIQDSISLLQELKLLHQNILHKGYSEPQIPWAINPPIRAPPQHREDPAYCVLNLCWYYVQLHQKNAI